jgi:hypothetical protein
MLRRVPVAHYSAVSAAWNAAYDLGWGAGAIGAPAPSAWVWPSPYVGYPAAFAVTALLVLAALPLACRSAHT